MLRQVIIMGSLALIAIGQVGVTWVRVARTGGIALLGACAGVAGIPSPVGAEQPGTSTLERDAIDYETLDPEAALSKKVELMLPHCRTNLEKEVLRVSHLGLLWGRRNNDFRDVQLEDLMAHARQESGHVLDLLDRGEKLDPAGAIGTNAWDFHSKSTNDLLGYTSFSVWQDILPHYLLHGRHYSSKITKLWNVYVAPYPADRADALIYGPAGHNGPITSEMQQMANAFRFYPQMVKKEGEELARAKVAKLVTEMTSTLAAEPELHVKVTAHLIQKNYRISGPRTPEAIRRYFCIEIQRNLKPESWINPVRFDDDIAPSPANGNTDNNGLKRGDYGKQIVLGSSYNDRGMMYWYAVTRDSKRLREIVGNWAGDPASLRRSDYEMLHAKGWLKYESTHPELYRDVLSQLP